MKALILLLAAAMLVIWWIQRPLIPAWHAPELTVSEKAWYGKLHRSKGTWGSIQDHKTGEWYFYNAAGQKCRI